MIPLAYETAQTIVVLPDRQRIELELEEVAAQRPPDDARCRVGLLHDAHRTHQERRHPAERLEEKAGGEGHVLPSWVDRGQLPPGSGRWKHDLSISCYSGYAIASVPSPSLIAIILLACCGWLLPVVAGAADRDLSTPGPLLRLERRPLAHDAGAELLTVFGPLAMSEAATDVPLVSVLRDTLGDDNTENNRLRYVWVLTSRRPGLLSRSVAALPFFYRRSGVGKPEDARPSPVLDLSGTGRDVWTAIAGRSEEHTSELQ